MESGQRDASPALQALDEARDRGHDATPLVQSMRAAEASTLSPALLARACSEIAARDLAPTLARAAVLALAWQAGDRHRTSEALCRLLLATGLRLPLSTFKAAIYELADIGLLRRVSVSRRNVLSHHYEPNDQPAHEHLFCERCQRIEDVHDDALLDLQRRMLETKGLRPAAVRGALLGTCRQCSEGNAPAPEPVAAEGA
ncbi:Fur family transcriptional regulator [Cupriavidus sp. 2TAF22]|uniref:Fur family transcriptional regulator n=1 Tax=unclassified Cupriavidus TaxID=2640874 RepID=UPI003F8E8025